MRKNYQQVRKQRELNKRMRQQEKQQRRTARLSVAAPAPAVEPSEGNPAAASVAIVRGAS